MMVCGIVAHFGQRGLESTNKILFKFFSPGARGWTRGARGFDTFVNYPFNKNI